MNTSMYKKVEYEGLISYQLNDSFVDLERGMYSLYTTLKNNLKYLDEKSANELIKNMKKDSTIELFKLEFDYSF